MRTFTFLLILFVPVLLWSQSMDTTAGTKTPDVRWNGSIGVGTQFYTVTGIENRLISPVWNLSGNASISIRDYITLPFSFSVGRQGSSATYPTFNQFGISPRYKALTLHAGWRRVRFSDFTLGDHTFLGAGFEFNPGKFRIAAIQGRFRKARDYDSSDAFAGLSAVYRRTGYGLKLGYGTEDTFFDLIYFKAKDDPNSLKVLNPDSTLTASENAVLGFNSRVKISAGFSFFAEGAVSAFTRDLTSPLSSESVPRPASDIIQPRFSTRANYAFKTGIETGADKWKLRLQYERIAPEYETMGSFFFMNDLENITIAPSLSLFNYKLRINGYAGIQKNNLLNTRSETTHRFIGVGNISLQASEVFGIDFNFNSVNIDQTQANARFSDTIRVALVTTHYSLAPRWLWIKDTTSVKSLTTGIHYQVLNDRNPFTREFTDMNTAFLNLAFHQNFPASGYGWTLGANYNIIRLPMLTTTRYGASAGGEIFTKDQKWTASSRITYNLSLIESERDGSVISGDVNIQFKPAARHSFSVNANLLRNTSAAFDDFTEIIWGVHYHYLFH
ncbi:MAG: hypothetical protein IPM26_09800 [Saprospiraceae bacterium]|nr:hypothetical protein [Saprospiraceae bacterium]